MSTTYSNRIDSSPEFLRTTHSLNKLALKGLVQMFNPEKQLFCFKLKRRRSRLIQKGISRRYTAIALMGLHRLQDFGIQSLIDIQRVFNTLLLDTDWVDNMGDYGLLLWLCALIEPGRLDEIERRLPMNRALTRFRDLRQGRTMELSWFLSGLSYQVLARPEKMAATQKLAADVYHRIRKNQGQGGFFGHVGKNEGVAGIVRSDIGSFADQIYPIYGMAKFSHAFGNEKATQCALDCALSLCEAQGSLGQWWWHYDSSSGQILERFPVFSVHQYGMAPMALHALGEAIQSDFTPWIYKGLQWIEDNELDCSMPDNSANVVWRCIERTRPRRIRSVALHLATRREDTESRTGLRVRHECRPYELGWLLYGLAPFSNQGKFIGRPSADRKPTAR